MAVKRKTTKKTAAKKTTAKKTEAPATTAASAETKPKTLKAARASGADDLKLLKGVGPKLEQTLNELGFYHFDQVASNSATDASVVRNNDLLSLPCTSNA